MTKLLDYSRHFQRAIVVGTVRNASKNIINDLLRITDALSEIMPTSAFVVESDSNDNTLGLLEDLSKRDSRIRVVSLGKVEPTIPDRISRLRHCRNAYVKELRVNPIYRDCDLVIVADLDGINTTISKDEFKLALDSPLKWDVLAANQTGRYYDILALRHPFWSPNNCILESQWLSDFVGVRTAWKHSVGDRMLRIPRDLEPISVESAFGGLCIYRRWIFEKFDYSEDIPESSEEIDHVTLHRKAREAGAKIFIHPGLVNSKWTVHSLNGVPFIRNAKWLAHKSPFNLLLPVLRPITTFLTKRK